MEPVIQEIIKAYGKKHIQLEFLQEIKSGKEATVYKVLYKDTLTALKVYKDHTKRAFQKLDIYTAGKYYRQPSIRRAIANNSSYGKAHTQMLWIKREFFLLEKLFTKGAAIPQPFSYTDTSILMEYLGSEDSPAPRLIDITLDEKEAKNVFAIILKNMHLFYMCGIVHSDLSAYNVLYFNNKPYIIDFPQSVDVRHNPNTSLLLKRDIDTICSYFSPLIPLDIESIYKEFSIKKEESL